MSGVQTLKVLDTDDGARLDRWFRRMFPHVPHGKVEKLLRTGQIRIDGARAKGNARISAGQDIRIPPLPDPGEKTEAARVSDADARAIRDMVLFENDMLFALNKPAGLAVQGGSKTLHHIDRMLPALGEGCRLVHRIDRDTSGILVIAKNAAAAALLGKAFASRHAVKTYWGITNGVPRPVDGEIKGYIRKGQMGTEFGKVNEGKEIMVAARHGDDGAKYARTLYRCVSMAGARAAWVVMQPLTGRTHQLRLHMQLLGAPLVGDPKYLTDRETPGRLSPQLHLHARELTLPFQDGRSLTFTAPLPEHFKIAFNAFGFDERTKIEPLDPL